MSRAHLERPRPEAAGLRERKKQRTWHHLQSAAMQLFEEKGFEATTIDEIAAAADVSARTVFRYFPTKQDIVFGDTKAVLAQLLESVATRPAGEGPLTAACAAAIECNATLDGTVAAQAVSLIAKSRQLQLYSVMQRDEWRRELGAALALRAGNRDPGPSEWVAAGIALGVMDGAAHVWHARGAESGKLRTTTAELVELVWALTNEPSPHARRGR